MKSLIVSSWVKCSTRHVLRISDNNHIHFTPIPWPGLTKATSSVRASTRLFYVQGYPIETRVFISILSCVKIYKVMREQHTNQWHLMMFCGAFRASLPSLNWSLEEVTIEQIMHVDVSIITLLTLNNKRKSCLLLLPFRPKVTSFQ